MQRRAKHVVPGMECLRTAVRFRPPPPNSHPGKSREVQKTPEIPGFFFACCPVACNGVYCNPAVSGGNFGGNWATAKTVTAMAVTAVRKARPAASPQKLCDGGGLYLLLQPMVRAGGGGVTGGP